VTKYQAAPVQQQDALADGDHSMTMPAPPPSLTYQPVPTVRTPMPPLASGDSGVHSAVREWPDEETVELASDPTSARDTVPSPPPEGAEEQEDTGLAAGDESSAD
jgi:hypothetical protein